MPDASTVYMRGWRCIVDVLAQVFVAFSNLFLHLLVRFRIALTSHPPLYISHSLRYLLL
jgi:hypothetical protein